MRFDPALKGTKIWVPGFFSFLAFANLVNSTIMCYELGALGMFTPFLVGWLTGPIPVYAYFLFSALAAFVFLGATCHMAVSELSVADQVKVIDEKANRLRAGQESQTKVLESVNARMFLADEKVEHTRAELSEIIADQGEAVKRSMKVDHQDQQKTMEGMQEQLSLLKESLKSLGEGLNDQAEVIKGINENLTVKVDQQLADFKETLRQLELNNASTTIAMSKQADEITEIKQKLERLEETLVKQKPRKTKKKKEKVAGYIQILSKP